MSARETPFCCILSRTASLVDLSLSFLLICRQSPTVTRLIQVVSLGPDVTDVNLGIAPINMGQSARQKSATPGGIIQKPGLVIHCTYERSQGWFVNIPLAVAFSGSNVSQRDESLEGLSIGLADGCSQFGDFPYPRFGQPDKVILVVGSDGRLYKVFWQGTSPFLE